MYVISSCLLGRDCKYNGGNNRNQAVLDFCREHSFCEVCPETAGGLTAPRSPAERQGDRVVDRDGKDVTEAFVQGAQKSWDHVLAEARRRCEEVEGAILKAKSPSCGCGMIYDGSFTGTLIPGDGCFTAILKEHGIKVNTEKEI